MNPLHLWTTPNGLMGGLCPFFLWQVFLLHLTISNWKILSLNDDWHEYKDKQKLRTKRAFTFKPLPSNSVWKNCIGLILVWTKEWSVTHLNPATGVFHIARCSSSRPTSCVISDKPQYILLSQSYSGISLFHTHLILCKAAEYCVVRGTHCVQGGKGWNVMQMSHNIWLGWKGRGGREGRTWIWMQLSSTNLVSSASVRLRAREQKLIFLGVEHLAKGGEEEGDRDQGVTINYLCIPSGLCRLHTQPPPHMCVFHKIEIKSNL